jgi:two-component system, cell cycle sensor histidine kinase and response regulator CckA
MTSLGIALNRRSVDILLVEDSRTDRLQTVAAIDACRIANRLHTVEDGIEALRFLTAEPPFESAPQPDLILLDLNLPKLDGRELLAYLKADPALRTIPVIVLTTSQAERDVAHAYSEYGSSYITKPLNLEKFSQALKLLGDYWFDVVTLPPRQGPARSLATGPTSRRGTRLLDEMRVLLVEDSQPDALLLETALLDAQPTRPSVQTAARLSDALGMLSARSFDVIVADLGLPDSRGLDTLRGLRTAASNTPIVVLTGLSDEAVRTAALQAGAQEYLVKGELGVASLQLSIRYAIDRQALEQQLLEAHRLQAIGQLATGLANQFNNILTVIQSNAELARSSDANHLLDEILVASGRATLITRQLLACSANKTFKRQTLDLNEIVRRVARLLGRLLESVQLDLQCDPQSPPILGDDGMVEQAIMNLVINARDAMPQGGVVRIQTTLLSGEALERASHVEGLVASTGFVRLMVSDQGPGVDPSLVDRIWEPFFTTKTPDRGTGVRLANVRNMAVQLGGWVELKSEVGVGSQFYVYFPVSDETTDRAPDRGQQRSLSTPVRSLKVLFVDDEIVLQRTMQRILRVDGHEVLVASSAEQGLRLWEESGGTIGLVITDLVMPGGMTGVELARVIWARGPSVPVIFSSGQGHRPVDPGPNHRVAYLRKPFGPDEVRLMVRECVDTWDARPSG